MTEVRPATVVQLYRRLPEEVRHCLRPLNCVDELASYLPPRVRQRVVRATEMGRRLAHLGRTRYALRRLEGRTASGASLACLLACDELSARYWRGALYAAPPAEERLGTLSPVTGLRMAGAFAKAADLSLWQTPWPLAAFTRRTIQIPSWVPLELATDRPLDAIVTGDRSGRAARKNDVRRVERSGLTARVTRDPATVERFHRELYEPYIRARFGTLGVLLPLRAFRHAARHGWLLLLEDATGVRSGALLEPHGRELRLLAFGAAGDDVGARVGIEGAYYHAIRTAVEHGFARLALGTSRPVLTDGVLRYKRKWGAHLGAPTTLDRFVLRARWTPAVQSVLAHAPLVVDRGDGGLAALVGSDANDAERLARVDVPGLREILLVGGQDGAVGAPYTPVRGVGVVA